MSWTDFYIFTAYLLPHLKHLHSALHQKQIHVSPHILLGQPAEVRGRLEEGTSSRKKKKTERQNNHGNN